MKCLFDRLRALFHLKFRRSKQDLDPEITERTACLEKSEIGSSTANPNQNARLERFWLNHKHHCINNSQSENALLPSQSTTTNIFNQKFTLFPNLPTELRLKIWQLAAYHPQLIEISCTPLVSSQSQQQWFSHSSIPSILHTNQESRTLALQHFTRLRFSPEVRGLPPPPLYVNFVSATLWLCADLGIEMQRELLDGNEQFREELRAFVVAGGSAIAGDGLREDVRVRELKDGEGEEEGGSLLRMSALLGGKWENSKPLGHRLKALEKE